MFVLQEPFDGEHEVWPTVSVVTNATSTPPQNPTSGNIHTRTAHVVRPLPPLEQDSTGSTIPLVADTATVGTNRPVMSKAGLGIHSETRLQPAPQSLEISATNARSSKQSESSFPNMRIIWMTRAQSL